MEPTRKKKKQRKVSRAELGRRAAVALADLGTAKAELEVARSEAAHYEERAGIAEEELGRFSLSFEDATRREARLRDRVQDLAQSTGDFRRMFVREGGIRAQLGGIAKALILMQDVGQVPPEGFIQVFANAYRHMVGVPADEQVMELAREIVAEVYAKTVKSPPMGAETVDDHLGVERGETNPFLDIITQQGWRGWAQSGRPTV